MQLATRMSLGLEESDLHRGPFEITVVIAVCSTYACTKIHWRKFYESKDSFTSLFLTLYMKSAENLEWHVHIHFVKLLICSRFWQSVRQKY